MPLTATMPPTAELSETARKTSLETPVSPAKPPIVADRGGSQPHRMRGDRD